MARLPPHATLCIAAYGFLISQRETIPPSATTMFPQFALREGYQPRGFAVAPERHVPNSIATMTPLSPRRSHVAQAAPLGTDTEIRDTVSRGSFMTTP